MTSLPNQRRRAILFLVAAAVFFSTAGMLIKLVQMPALAVAGGRSAIAAIVILIYIRKPRFTWSPVQLGCAVAYCGTVLLFVVANKTTTAANAILLQYTAPVYIGLFSAWFVGERTRGLDWLTILLVLVGMTLFLLDGLAAGNWFGNAVAMGSAMCFAMLAMLLRKQKDASPFESVLLGNILTALIGLPSLLSSRPGTVSILALTFLGVVQLGIAYIMFVLATKHVSALEMVLIPVIEPILNPIWVALTVGEFPSFMATIGGLIVLLAVVGRGVLSSRQTAR